MSLNEKYIQEAADRIMIQDLLGRYAFAADYGKGDPETWAVLFIEEGRFEIPEISLVVACKTSLTKFMEGLHRTVPGLHHVMSNFVIEIDGDRAGGNASPTSSCCDPKKSTTICRAGMRTITYGWTGAGISKYPGCICRMTRGRSPRAAKLANTLKISSICAKISESPEEFSKPVSWTELRGTNRTMV